MTGLRRLILFVLFAVIATIANLAVQRLVLSIDRGTLGFIAAVFFGTLVGLLIKYVLDKRWIFHDVSSGVAAHSKKFALYTAMGVVTTAIFWITETVFWMVWRVDEMRELGAVIGLAIGYTVKYQLDRRYVFVSAEQGKPA